MDWLGPLTTLAHGGLVLRQNLPIPEELFVAAAAIVLFVSFAALAVLWPKPRLQEIDWRPIPGGRAIASRPVEIACGAIGVALFALVLYAGFAGTQSGPENLAPTFILILFWVGLAFASVLFGDVFRAFNPWRAIGRVIAPVLPAPRQYPERLGRWPAALGILGFTWIELATDYGNRPSTLATAAAVYAAVMLAGQAVYGVDTWERRGDGFAVYFNLFSRISIWETRDRVLGLRPLLGGLPKLDTPPGTVALVVVMIGSVTFDGLSQGRVWRDVEVELNTFFADLGFGFTTVPRLTATVGLLAGVLIAGAFYRLGIEGARSVGGGFDGDRLRRTFVHTLVPIALVYVAAHYLTYLVFEGQRIKFLISDPLGDESDIFGTANQGIDFSLLSQNLTWYLQVGFVVAGHVAGLVLAHDRALAIYDDAKRAVRSQYWMLAIMVGFTTLALWLLKEAGQT